MNRENLRAPGNLVVDLASEADFRLGDLKVCPSTREVEQDGQREMLEPRVMQVLVALCQAQGRVVSRDDLIARCWEGRIVGEDAISRAIWRLRKLAEADQGENFSIETIPRVGYRLRTGPSAAEDGLNEMAPADEAGKPEDGAGKDDSAGMAGRALRGPGWRLAAGLALLAAFASVLAVWLLWPQRRWTVESSRTLISTLALEGEPAFSPDGKMLAYTSGPDTLSRKIYVRNVAGGEGIRITADAYDDVSPSWSPDGAHIAYVAQKPGEPCRIMVAAVPAGGAREVGRCLRAERSSVSWQTGTPFLYFSDRAAEANAARRLLDTVVRLDLDSGARRTLAKTSANPILTLRRLQCSPDGRSLLLVGRENAATDALVIHDFARGMDRVLGKILIGGSAAWAEDSRTVLAAKASGLGSEITAYPVDGAAPYSVYTAAVNVSHLAAGAGGLLALETDPSRQNLARASTAQAAAPDIIDPANGRSWAPTFAPDGTLAFLSNRSGANAIWVIRPGGIPTLLYDGGLSPLFRLEFSPDGKYLAMPVATENGVTVNILTVDGANVTSFHSPTLGTGAPTWTPDSKAVILLDISVPAYVRVDIANSARRRPVAPVPWGSIVYHKGGMFGARVDKPGYWRIDGEAKLVSGKYPIRWEETPALLGDDLLVPDFKAAGGPRILAQPLAGGPDRVLSYAPGAQAQEAVLESKMVVNPRTGEIIYVAAAQSDTNIDLLTLAKR